MSDCIEPPIAHWSSNSLRPETCDLRPEPDSLALLIHRYGPYRAGTAERTGRSSSSTPTMDGRSAALGGGR